LFGFLSARYTSNPILSEFVSTAKIDDIFSSPFKCQTIFSNYTKESTLPWPTRLKFRKGVFDLIFGVLGINNLSRFFP